MASHISLNYVTDSCSSLKKHLKEEWEVLLLGFGMRVWLCLLSSSPSSALLCLLLSLLLFLGVLHLSSTTTTPYILRVKFWWVCFADNGNDNGVGDDYKEGDKGYV